MSEMPWGVLGCWLSYWLVKVLYWLVKGLIQSFIHRSDPTTLSRSVLEAFDP
jgi:hypothetical protein